MKNIRKAEIRDISRIAEILIFTKRMNYRPIFKNDAVSFGELQVLPLAQKFLEEPSRLDNIWVYDDGFVKALIHIESQEILELYVDSFFENMGIGAKLITFAKEECNVRKLWVLEKNKRAIEFYKRNGFEQSEERTLEEGTPEFLIRMVRNN